MRSVRFLPLYLAAWVSNASAFSPSATATAASTSALNAKTSETESPPRRQPWDVLRFLRQSSRFVSFPFVLPQSTSKIQPGQAIWKPSSSLFFQWAPLDDVVMGGASASTVDQASGLWKGTVTDANSGGFVGIRSTPPTLSLDLTACRGLEWTFRSSPQMPRRLKVVLRDTTEFNGIAWTTSVDVPNAGANAKQVKLRVPLSQKSLVPTIFASIVKDAPEKGIDKSRITALQLVYSKFEYEGALNSKFKVGDFELQLLEVRAY